MEIWRRERTILCWVLKYVLAAILDVYLSRRAVETTGLIQNRSQNQVPCDLRRDFELLIKKPNHEQRIHDFRELS